MSDSRLTRMEIDLPAGLREELQRLVDQAQQAMPWWQQWNLDGAAAVRGAERVARSMTAASAAALLTKGRCHHVSLDLGDDVIVVETIVAPSAPDFPACRTVLVFVALGPVETFVSPCAEAQLHSYDPDFFADPRWALWEAGRLLRRRWQWMELPGLHALNRFSVSGDAVAFERFGPVDDDGLTEVLGDGYDPPISGQRLDLALGQVRAVLRSLPLVTTGQ